MNIEFAFEALQPLGLTPAMAGHLAQYGHLLPPGPPSRLARVTEVHRDAVSLHDGLAQCNARSRPSLLSQLGQQATALAVGDWVLCSRLDDGSPWVEALLPPLTHIARRDGDGSRHPVASNVDTALLVMGLDLDFNPQRLERYLALAKGAGVQPVLVLTKADVLAASDGDGAVADVMALLRERVGTSLDMLAADARAHRTAQALAPYLGLGQTLVLLGSSGAGKSTLTNTLLGIDVQDTGGVREHDSRGKHTTTSRSLHQLPGGACLIDTPGVRTLQADISAAQLDQVFDDVAALAPLCRFRDCSHGSEPGCAVRDAVPEARLRNYHKLLRESQRDTQTPLQRQQQRGIWKTLHRQAQARAQDKRCGSG